MRCVGPFLTTLAHPRTRATVGGAQRLRLHPPLPLAAGTLARRRLVSILHPGRLLRRRLVSILLCAGVLPGAQIAERAGGLSPSWPGPRCARPRAHAPGTQRPLPRSFARCRYLDRCRLLLSASAVLGAAKRLGAGLSLRPYFVARRQLLQRGPQRVELAAVEAWRCAPAPLTAPCACAMTPATLCTDPAPPDALTCRLTPSRPTAA